MKQPEDNATPELPMLDAMGHSFSEWVTPEKRYRSDPNWPYPVLDKSPASRTPAAIFRERDALKVQQAVATQQNPGAGFRERERLKRKAERWVAKVWAMPQIEREYVLTAIANIVTNGEGA